MLLMSCEGLLLFGVCFAVDSYYFLFLSAGTVGSPTPHIGNSAHFSAKTWLIHSLLTPGGNALKSALVGCKRKEIIPLNQFID